MSSHHVIRDEQEPPVFILDIENQLDTIKELLGWSPSVWVLEEHAEWLMSQNVKVDGVLSIHPESHLRLTQQSGEYLIERYNENSLLKAIIQTLDAKAYTGVNIFCNTTQKDLIIQSSKELALSIPLSLFVDDKVTIIIFNTSFRKWYPRNQELKVLKGNVWETTNVKKLNGYYLVEEEGFFKLKTEKGPIILTEL
ncbi:hypothetical protein JKA74_12265 [Marivirga sp. S37H4]|uniref:Thiamine pyrophosphokinase n=1 Tax=Marivirga aurantiaca TaxID=2802615 RepID=A0A935C958_9BACT|nr:hypothetical protein [Marivirga aurantiaca]MBK6265809.1 hypothetical protein [Marivirga aurantiaca]